LLTHSPDAKPVFPCCNDPYFFPGIFGELKRKRLLEKHKGWDYGPADGRTVDPFGNPTKLKNRSAAFGRRFLEKYELNG